MSVRELPTQAVALVDRRSRSQLRLLACRRRRRCRRVVVIAIYSHALFALRRFVSSSCSVANFNSSPKVAR